MPNVHVPLPETEQTIFRPVVLSVVRQVQALTGIKDTQIYFPDKDNKIQTSGAGLDSKNDGFAETTSKRMNSIEVDETIDREQMSPTFFNSRECPPIFEDRYLGVAISPIYAKHNVTIKFNYKTGSKTESNRWLQDIRLKMSKLRDINTHTVSYHYNLHTDIFKVLEVIHKLRESQAGYNQTFEEYVRSNSTGRLTTIDNVKPGNAIYAISETQTEIYGQFVLNSLFVKPEKDETSGMWSIIFEYEFNYDKPIGLNMKYPIVVHNQPMPLELVSFMTDETREIAKQPFHSSKSQGAFMQFRADIQMDSLKSHDGIIVIPRFDDFKQSTRLSRTVGLIQTLTVISNEDKRTLVDLNDLGDYVLDPDLLNFLRLEYSYINRPYRSFFNLGFYKDSTLQGYNSVTINSNLVISSTEDLDIRSQYRIRLGLATDIGILERGAIERLRLYPKLLYKIVCAINAGFRENPELADLGKLDKLSLLEFSALYRGLLNNEPGLYSSENIGWDVQGIFRNLGINPNTLHRISMQARNSRRTMIFGVLAYKRNDPNLIEAQAGNLVIA